MALTTGLVEIYMGDGKGKTTAALGQAMRSAGCGLKVYMVQFLKSGETGELESSKKLYPEFRIFRFEKPRGFFWTLSDTEKKELIKEIDKAFSFCMSAAENNECDVLILDEIMGVLQNKLLPVERVINLIKGKPQTMEIIMTGREAPREIIEIADLVTEMKEIKHYYKKGIPARKGIEY